MLDSAASQELIGRKFFAMYVNNLYARGVCRCLLLLDDCVPRQGFRCPFLQNGRLREGTVLSVDCPHS